MSFKELLAGLLLLLALYQCSCRHNIRILKDKKLDGTWVDSKRYNYVKEGYCGGATDGIAITSSTAMPVFQDVPFYTHEFHSPALDWLVVSLRIPLSGPASGSSWEDVRARVILKLDGVQVAQSGLYKDNGIGLALWDIDLSGQIYKLKEGPHKITVEAAVADTLNPTTTATLYLPYCNNDSNYPALLEGLLTPTIEGFLDLLGQITKKKETKKKINYDQPEYYENNYYGNEYYENEYYDNDHYDL